MMNTYMRIKLATGLAGAALATSQSHAAITAHWNFDGNVTEQVGSTAGTLFGSAAANGAAIAPSGANSLNLPSSGSYLETNTTGGLGGTGSFTVFAFIRTTTTADATFFNYSPSSGGTGGADLRMFVQANGDLRIEASQGAGFNLSNPGWDLGDGNTHAVAAVFNSSTGNSFRDIDLYVNGTLYDVTGGTDHTINLGAAGEIFFGRDQVSAGNRPFVGLIDNVSIHNTALSLTELNALAIPEPSGALIGGLSVLFMLRRRR